MRLSAFNLYLEEFPSPGNTLVYNTFSGSFVEMENEALANLRRLDKGEVSPSEIDALDPELWDTNVGVLVESRKQEEKDFRVWFETMRNQTAELSAIVSVTFACNFACTYCCQEDVMTGHLMKTPTAESTAEFLANRALEIGARRIELIVTGGEPLLYPARVEALITDVRNRVQQAGIQVAFQLITNGLFLSRELVQKWIPLGLKAAQVTLDGDETTHGLTRKSKDGAQTFEKIFSNIVDVCDLIAINLNGNYQVDTVHGFAPLLLKLKDAGFRTGSKVRFTPALAALSAPSEAASGSCTMSGSTPEHMLYLHDRILAEGYDPGEPMRIGPCQFFMRHHYSIDPHGHIYKCPGFLGHPDWAIGHVSSGLTERFEGLAAINPQRNCGGCSHRPHCAGGCVAAEWLRQGRAEGVSCEIGFLERESEQLLRRQVAYARGLTGDDYTAIVPEMPSPRSSHVAHAATAQSLTSRREGQKLALRVLA